MMLKYSQGIGILGNWSSRGRTKKKKYKWDDDYEMMNQATNTQTLASLGPNSVKNQCVVNKSQGQTSSYVPSTTGSEVVSWNMYRVDNHSVGNGSLSNSIYHHVQHTEPSTRTIQDGSNAASLAPSSSVGLTNAQPVYIGYNSYSNSADPYSYGSTGYQGYYNGYQQQPNHSYSQPVGVYQNTGAPYQPLSSFQNAGSYAGPTSYSSTYYNPGDYQTAGGYPSSDYSHQTTTWSEGNYANYTTHQYSNCTPDTSGAYTTGNAATNSLHYQQHYKQWVDYYNQTEVTCAPGTENLSIASTSTEVSQVPSVSGGYPTSNSPAPLSFTPSWRPESSSSLMPSLQPGATVTGSYDSCWKHGAPSFQNQHPSPVQPHFQKPSDSKSSYDNFHEQQKTACPQGPDLQYPVAQQAPQNYQPPLQTVQSLDTRRVSKLQIQTNPRIASNLPLGLQKLDKDVSNNSAVAKPAYISVSLPKPSEKVLPDDAADSVLKAGVFRKSLKSYVERALGQCKDEKQMTACQEVMKEIITKATNDGTLHTRDWDAEPLFPIPDADMTNTNNLQNTTPVSLFPKYKKSPTRRSKSRWEPLPEEKPVDKLVSVNNYAVKYSSWAHVNEKDRKPAGANSEGKTDVMNDIRFLLMEQKSASKTLQRPVKRQRLGGVNAADSDDASSDSDKEDNLIVYNSGAIALAKTPEERKRRENRSKRFEKVQGNQAQINHFKAKNAGNGNLYGRRASALVLSKSFEDGGSRAVEDIDWDALTVKGTCQEIEKRYLRLTSAPDPSTVRPGEVLEKALSMVQNSQKNYLYKCDQLKSIRQDLTVQRIRNQLTVKVYETHARLALEVGDLPEYNQCQSQLKILYAEGIEGCHMEFSAYNLLCVIMHSNNNRDLLSSMSRLSNEAKKDTAVQHALAVRAAVTSGNYVMFFRLYKTAPNLNTCLMDLYVEKMRYKAVSCMSRSYRPQVPISYIARVLGFSSGMPTNEGSDEKDSDGLEDCVDWLKAHGACLVADSNGEMQLDTKASSSSLYMPDPEDAVAHGDASLAVNDFLTRTSS
ncbi:SAC3 family protein A-like isoform X2 [Durio zibethinus]|uniref:SAC3 family protein A-like isoform X2 n=1 Tax=Durio zibethinus TaxID=66656 RepID=A0A6P5YZM2_DURZI|nr:SAC3 family protein A-like isoform X2 [Durio zibethinus]